MHIDKITSKQEQSRTRCNILSQTKI